MPRDIAHVVETASKDMVRNKIDTFYENGDALVREWTERDYGIDFLMELFEDGMPTGKIAFLQIKGTSNEIIKLVRSDEVSCKGVSSSSLEYAHQNRIPFILIYASIAHPAVFYYVDLHSVIKKLLENRKNEDQKEFTIRIPYQNKVDRDLTGFFKLVNKYY